MSPESWGPLNPFPTPTAQVYVWYLNATDADSQHSNVTFSFTVEAALVASLSANLSATDVRFSVTFSYSFAGGVTPVTWSIHINGSSSNVTGATGGTWVWIPLFTGSYTFYLNSTDAIGFTSKVNTTVTVHADLGASLSSSPILTELTLTSTLTYSFSGGTSAITWTLKVNGSSSNLTGASGGHYTYSPTHTGTYTFYLNATDSVGSSAKATCIVIVKSALTAALTSYPTTGDAGTAFRINLYLVGGVGPVSWTFHENGSSSNITGVVNGAYSATLSAVATYTFYLNATDAPGKTASATVTIPVVGDLVAHLSSAPSLTEVGHASILTYSFTGGTGGTAWTLKINGSSSNLTGASGGHYTFTPAHSGTYTFYLNASDTSGFTARATARVIVNPNPTARLNATPSSTYVGGLLELTLYLTGGVGPTNWTLTINGSSSNISGVVNYTYAFVPAYAASYSFYLNSTDSLGATARASLMNLNATVPAPASVDASANSSALTVVWSPSAGHVLNYTLEYGTSPSNLSHHVSVGVVTSYTVANVTIGVTWYVAIIAWEPAGHSPLSGIATARTIMPGGNATNLGPLESDFLFGLVVSFLGLLVSLFSGIIVYTVLRRRYG